MKITIDYEDYREMCFDRISKYWERENGDTDMVALELVLDTIENIYSDNDTLPDIAVLVDNLVVNSEIVEKDDFAEDGNYSSFYNQYSGNWDEFLQDCFCGNDDIAVVNVYM